MATTTPLLLTTKEASELLGHKSPRRLRRKIARGQYDPATRQVVLDGRVIAVNDSNGDERRIWLVTRSWLDWYAAVGTAEDAA